MKTENTWKGIVIGILLLNFLLLASLFFTPKKTVESHQLTVKQQIHLECQKIAGAYAPESWSYKSCVESIMNADKTEASILKTI